jgi:hypothetical protein
MSYQTCKDCGSKVYNGHCIYCHEETFIADQYRDLGEPVPQSIADKEYEQSYDETNFKETK